MKAFWSHPGGEQASRLAVLRAEPLVWLDPYHQPLSALEQRLYALLAGGPLPLQETVERLAEGAVYQGRQAGDWSLEVGAQALPVLRAEAQQALAGLDGSQIAIETPPPLRAAAFASWQLQLCA